MGATAVRLVLHLNHADEPIRVRAWPGEDGNIGADWADGDSSRSMGFYGQPAKVRAELVALLEAVDALLLVQATAS